MADNYHFHIISDRTESIEEIFELIFAHHKSPPNQKTLQHSSGFALVNDSLVFFKYGGPKEFIPFLTPLPAAECARQTKIWLDDAIRAEEPDHDGMSKPGFEITTGSFTPTHPAIEWFSPLGYHDAILAIRPVWTLYGK